MYYCTTILLFQHNHQGSFVFDGHNDLPYTLRKRASSSFSNMDIAGSQPDIHTDIPRLRKGNVGAQYWSVYVPASTGYRGEALKQTLEQIAIVHDMIQVYPDTFALARNYEDILNARRQGKIASLIGVEGGHSIENSMANLHRLFDLGARYMTLTHSDTLMWADSATDQSKHDGLNVFGEAVVREMNALGMIVDLSHVSEATMHDALDVSVAPVMFSHSSARTVADHVRNVPDAVLKRMSDNGGIVMVNFFSGFIDPKLRRSCPTCLTCRVNCERSMNLMMSTTQRWHGGEQLTRIRLVRFTTSSITSTTW